MTPIETAQGQGDLVIKEALEAALANLKSDLGREFAGMEPRLADLELRMTEKLAAQQRWYVGPLFVAAGLAVAAIKLI